MGSLESFGELWGLLDNPRNYRGNAVLHWTHGELWGTLGHDKSSGEFWEAWRGLEISGEDLGFSKRSGGGLGRSRKLEGVWGASGSSREFLGIPTDLSGFLAIPRDA